MPLPVDSASIALLSQHLGEGVSQHTDRWGTVPQWLSGVGGTASSSFALYIIFRDKRRQERKQAELVLVTVQWQLNIVPGIGSMREIHVHNASPLPIYGVRLVRPSSDRPVDFIDGPLLRMGDIAAGETAIHDWDSAKGRNPIAVSFIDTDGTRWARSTTGFRLERFGRGGKLYKASRDREHERLHNDLYKRDRPRRWRARLTSKLRSARARIGN